MRARCSSWSSAVGGCGSSRSSGAAGAEHGQRRTRSVGVDRELESGPGLEARLASIAADWLDVDATETIPHGAEDPLYTGLTPAYRTANQPISNVTELAALDGMDRNSFDILLPHVTALPGRTAINVNTATAQVLQSLGDNITLSDAEGLITLRDDGGFADYAGVFAPLVDPDLQDDFSETSNYFQLKAVVQIDTVRISLFTVLYRSPNGSDVIPISRSLGTI